MYKQETNPIRIILADDHHLFLTGLHLLLNDASVELMGTASNGKELLQLLKQQETDIVLLDINMPVWGGLEAASEIKKSFPKVKLIFLSSYDEQYLIDKAKAIGASGYLQKTCSKEELLSTILVVVNGSQYFPGSESQVIRKGSEQELFLRQYNLTKREIEILYLIRDGLSSQQMADRLFLSVLTIETHRKHILQKLGLNKTTSLVQFMAKNHL